MTALVAMAYPGEHLRPEIMATVRDAPGQPFGAPVTVARARYEAPPDVDVAVGPSGDALIVWSETPVLRRGPARVMAARRAPGGAWGPPEAIATTAPLDELDLMGLPVSVEVDAAGRATIAWTLPTGDDFDDTGRIEVATAARGAPFGPPERLSPGVSTESAPSLTVTPSGRALIAAPGSTGILAWDRAVAGAAFGPPQPVGDEIEAFGITARMRDDGAAVLAYAYQTDDGSRPREGVALSRRPAGRAFLPPDRLWSGPAVRDSGGGFIVSARGRGRLRQTRPGEVRASGFAGSAFLVARAEYLPESEPQPRVALSADGRLALSATVRRARPGGDAVAAPLIATGTLDGPLSTAVRGSPCRSTNGNAAFVRRDGAPSAGWTDNASMRLGELAELATGAGRVHALRPGGAPPAASGAAAPTVRIAGPRRPQRLYGGQALKVKVGCGAACDVRLTVVGRGGLRAAASATLRRAGRRTLSMHPQFDRPIAPRRPGRVRLRADACSPDGAGVSTAHRRLKLVRRPRPPVARPVHLRARRVRGGDVVVSWRTIRRARRVRFSVDGASLRSDHLDPRIPFASTEGRGRRSFRVRLRSIRGYRIRAATVGVEPYDPPWFRGPAPVSVRVRR